MKKIFLLATAAIIVLASCTKTQIIETPADQNVIGFENFLHKATKADAITNSNVTAQSIKVYSYLMNAKTGSTSGTAYFDDVISYTSGWKTPTLRYWPETTTSNPATQSLSFFAYLPSDISATYAYNPTTPTTMPTLAYTIPMVADQKDVLVASKVELNNENKTTPNVGFEFKHILSQIAFSIAGQQNDGLKYTVKEVSINDVANNSTYTFGTTDAAGFWATPSGTESYVYNGTFATVQGNAPQNGSNVLMLMPQTLGSTAKLTIKYYVVDGVDNPIYGTDANPVVKEKPITGTWAQSTKYTYAITIPAGEAPITYTVHVAEWDAASSTIDM